LTAKKTQRNTKSGKSNNSDTSADSGFDDLVEEDNHSDGASSLEEQQQQQLPSKSITPELKPTPTEEAPKTENKENVLKERQTENRRDEDDDDEGADDADTVLFDPDAKKPVGETNKEKVQRMKSPGIAFEINFDSSAKPTRKRMPPRLKAIVTSQKREPTLFELDRKLRAAEQLRKEQIAKITQKAGAHNSKVEGAEEKLSRERTSLDDSVFAKEQTAIENRRKHMKEMQKKLAKKEAHAKQVRARAHSGSSTRSVVSNRSESARSTASHSNRGGSATSTKSTSSTGSIGSGKGANTTLRRLSESK